MDERNPYAPSPASLDRSGSAPQLGAAATAWRDAKVLVIVPDSPMPPRCIKCNEPAHEPTKNRKVYWHHPGYYFLLLLNILLYAIVALFVRKTARVNAGLCAGHKKRRRIAIALGWVGALAGTVLLVASASADDAAPMVILGLFVTMGSVVASMIYARVVYAKRIDASYVRLKGCGQAFLESLPPFPG